MPATTGLPYPLATAVRKIERAGLEGLLVFIPSLPAEPVGRGEDLWPVEGRIQLRLPIASWREREKPGRHSAE